MSIGFASIKGYIICRKLLYILIVLWAILLSKQGDLLEVSIIEPYVGLFSYDFFTL